LTWKSFGDTIERMLQSVALVELALCWVAWLLGFVGPSKQAGGQRKVVRAPASRWGILLQTLGFALVFAYVRPVGLEKSAPCLIASMILGPLSVALGWLAARQLGKQWRYEAALNEDHEFIQTGPYRWVRHPIYASMLGLVLATGAAWTWWPMLVASLILFLIGTEIRVRTEDRLLAERFQESFIAYRSRVCAYIPFIR
jgi:protein-S-isoprenylcysteine O-methyltransferase Ste14